MVMIVVSDLTVSPATSTISDHFLIKFEASLPVLLMSAQMYLPLIGPSTIAAFGQQLPEVLAPFTAETGSVENFTSDLNVVFSSLLDSIARLTTRAIKEV